MYTKPSDNLLAALVDLRNRRGFNELVQLIEAEVAYDTGASLTTDGPNMYRQQGRALMGRDILDLVRGARDSLEKREHRK